MKKIKASVILSFVTGKLYPATPPQELFSDLFLALLGWEPLNCEVGTIRQKYLNAVLSQCPQGLRDVCAAWQHGDDWPERIAQIDQQFGEIEIRRKRVRENKETYETHNI